MNSTASNQIPTAQVNALTEIDTQSNLAEFPPAQIHNFAVPIDGAITLDWYPVLGNEEAITATFEQLKTRAERMLENFEFEMAENFVNHTAAHIFLTGKAGTGKTTFLREVIGKTTKNCVVVAPTGVAAINAGGTRAQENLIVVADTKAIDILSKKDDELYALVDYVRENGITQILQSITNKFIIGFSNN